MRGGLGATMMTPMDAAKIGNYTESTIALNGSYNFLHSLASGSKIIRQTRFNSDLDHQTRKIILQDMYKNRSTTVPKSEFKKYNVVLIFLESWALVNTEKIINNQEVTPFFNKLKTKSLSVRAMFAGGHRTAEGIFATLCSAQNPLGKAVPNTPLEQYFYRCYNAHFT